MRLPNGFGSVYKLSGNRRNPYIARKTIGWDENGKQQYFTIGYFGTKKEGLAALAEHYIYAYNTSLRQMTFAELYAQWAKEKFPDISESNVRGYKAAYKHAAFLYNMRFVDIRTQHLQRVVDLCPKGYQMLRKIRTLFSQLYNYALEHDICVKNYAVFVKLGRNPGSKEKRPFDSKEIAKLFRVQEAQPFADTVLILIYTGLRISELLNIRTADINLKERIMRGGLKTEAGKNRLIPISKKILPMVRARVQAGHEYLITDEDGVKLNYCRYRHQQWDPLMERLGMCHTPHETRHTFITMASNAGADPVSVKRIVGHACSDLTDRVYTHKDAAELRKAVDMLP